MKIGQLAKQSGLSAHTLRYYERIGLLPAADRDKSGQRNYDASMLTWLNFLSRLKATGMPIRNMVRYAILRESGAETECERQQLLEVHRDQVRKHVSELQSSLLVLDTKIANYGGSIKRMKAHDTYVECESKPRKSVRTREAKA